MLVISYNGDGIDSSLAYRSRTVTLTEDVCLFLDCVVLQARCDRNLHAKRLCKRHQQAALTSRAAQPKVLMNAIKVTSASFPAEYRSTAASRCTTTPTPLSVLNRYADIDIETNS